MTLSNLARPYGGVAYREEAGDRGDEGPGLGSGEDEAAKAAAAAETAKVAASEAEKTRLAEKAEREKAIAIPKARHDEAVGKERTRAEAAEKRAAELEAAEKARQSTLDVKKVEADIEKLNEELDKALADNNPAEKARLRAAIREKERSLARAEARADARQEAQLAVEQERYNSAVELAERDYPFLDPTAEGFHDEMASAIMAMKAGLEQQGLASTAALKRAIKTLKPQLDALKKAEKVDDTEGADKAAAEAKEKAAAEEKVKAGKAAVEEARLRAEAVAKGAAAAKAQPAAGAAAGAPDKRAKEQDVKKMSQKEFDALPDEEVKRLRGDST